MRILVINPNSSAEMTEAIARKLLEVKRPDTDLEVVKIDSGPPVIDSLYDENLVVPEVLALVSKANREGYDAVLIACFSDPGLDAAKEISLVPVVGIGEASLLLASLLGHKFTVITPVRQRIPSKERYVRMLGLAERLASVRSLELSMIDTCRREEETKRATLNVAQKAIEEDGAEVIVLACAGMAGYGDLSEVLDVPVLDPVAVGLKVAEVLVDLGLTQSKIGLFAPPEKVKNNPGPTR